MKRGVGVKRREERKERSDGQGGQGERRIEGNRKWRENSGKRGKGEKEHKEG